MCKQDLALNNLQGLICDKIRPTNQTTNQPKETREEKPVLINGTREERPLQQKRHGRRDLFNKRRGRRDLFH